MLASSRALASLSRRGPSKEVRLIICGRRDPDVKTQSSFIKWYNKLLEH